MFIKTSSCIRTNLYRGAIFILPMRVSLANVVCEERSMYVARCSIPNAASATADL